LSEIRTKADAEDWIKNLSKKSIAGLVDVRLFFEGMGLGD